METSAAEISREPSGLSSVTSRRFFPLSFDILAAQHGHLFPWSAVMLGAGVGIFFALRFEPALSHAVTLLLTVTLAWLAGLKLRPEIRPCIWMICLVLFGVAIASVRTHFVTAPVLGFRYYGPIEGRVIAIDRSNSEKTRLTLDHVRLDRMDPQKTPAKVRVSLHGDQPFLTPKPGMRVALTGHLSPPSGPVEPGAFDFQRNAWFKQLGAVGYTRSPALRLAPAETNSFALKLYKFRKSLADGIKNRMAGREGPFAAAIITGDRTDIDKAALQDLRRSNLAHLLAISGLHMGLLTGAVFALMRVLMSFSPVTISTVSPKKIAALVALVAATLYLGVSGASVATQRAFIMASVMLVAICLDRRALTLRAVAVAALLVLLFRPESLVGPGFQMSFAATVALVAVFAALRETTFMYALPGWVRGFLMLVLSSGVAGLATAPFGAAHFNQMANYGLLANLISVPVMGFVVMPGAILGAIMWPFGLEALGLEIMRLGLAWILGVASFVSGLDGSTNLIIQPPQWVLPLVTLGGLFLCLWQGRFRLLGMGPILVAFALWSGTERPPVLISQSGLLIGVLDDTGRVLNKPKGDGFTAQNWLENDADPADQEAASLRGDLGRKTGVIVFGGSRIRYDMAKDLTEEDLRVLCNGAALLLVPNVKLDGPCPTITQLSLRKTGAIAARIGDDGLELETANARRGTRIWVPD